MRRGLITNGTIEVGGVPLDATQTYGVRGAVRGLLGPTLRVKPGDLIDLPTYAAADDPGDDSRAGRPGARRSV
ncbi:MAG: hypothetical protein ICV69_14130 [Thermoleophilaceae bacterium]|nr:hypothetical protein [Thermoleophilaceae bacterium]